MLNNHSLVLNEKLANYGGKAIPDTRLILIATKSKSDEERTKQMPRTLLLTHNSCLPAAATPLKDHHAHPQLRQTLFYTHIIHKHPRNTHPHMHVSHPWATEPYLHPFSPCNTKIPPKPDHIHFFFPSHTHTDLVPAPPDHEAAVSLPPTGPESS